MSNLLIQILILWVVFHGNRIFSAIGAIFFLFALVYLPLF